MEGPSLTTGTEDGVASQDWAEWMQWDWEDPNIKPPHSESSLSPSQSVNDATSRLKPNLDQLPAHPQTPNTFVSLLPDDNSISAQDASWSSSYWPGSGLQPLSSNNSSTRKRKTASDDSTGNGDDSPPELNGGGPKKRSHNVIEKRYRANLNEKIAELRDSVPNLRATAKRASGDSPNADDADGIAMGGKLNKASILSQATAYIHHLEQRNKRLEEENRELKTKLLNLDKTVADHTVTSSASVTSPSATIISTESGSMSPPSVFSHDEGGSARKSSTPFNPPEGLIKLPDHFKKMRDSTPRQGVFAESYIKDDTASAPKNDGTEPERKRMKFANKYMLGTLAALMVVDGLSTPKDEESKTKALFSVPVSFINDRLVPLWRYWQTRVSYSWYSSRYRPVSNIIMAALVLVGCAFIIFLYLFNSKPTTQRNRSKHGRHNSTDSVLPADLRRQAWETSMQRAGVPRHQFFHEWRAVTTRWVEYSLGCILGWKLYSWITGITEEDEKGRVKTWDIAIDAQIAGGDPEVSKSRLVLTIFASGTLPTHPARIMLKALHCRILLWRVGDTGSTPFNISRNVSCFVARQQWNLARRVNDGLPDNHPDALPTHLARLVEHDCDEVLIDSIVQRATNLTWNRPTQEAIDEHEALLDVVVDDPAIQSSLDYLASWWSSHILQQALLESLRSGIDSKKVKNLRASLKPKFDLALATAPPLSAAYARALAVKALFYDENRLENIQTVLKTLPSRLDKQAHASNFLDSSIPVTMRQEIQITVRCAMIAAVLDAQITNGKLLPASFTAQEAMSWFNQIPLDPVNLTLLGFASAYHLLHILREHSSDLTLSSSSDSLSSLSPKTSDSSSSPTPKQKHIGPSPEYGRIAGDLVYWARNSYNPSFYGLSPELVDSIEDDCLAVCKYFGVDIENKKSARKAKLRKNKKQERKPVNKKDESKLEAPPSWKVNRGSVAEVNGRNDNTIRRESLESNGDPGYGSLGA